jgi:spermidine/putrescine transport system ATP-binding protein
MAGIAIAIRGVTKIFPGADHPALGGVTLDVQQNEFFTLLGPSGCGKTTLLRMIGGFEHPNSGSITIDGQPMGQRPPNQRPVNTVFQSSALFPHMTVAQNIAFALEMLNQDRATVRDRVLAMARLVQLEALTERKPAQLSGGQQQRVALARALASAPKVLLLDEPLSALDHKLRKDMQVELKRLQAATGITFVFVTHDQEEALTMSDRIAVMRQGQVMQVGAAREIYDQPVNRFVADFIGETNFLPGRCLDRQGVGGRFAVQLSADEAHTLQAGDANGVQAGQDVVLAIRPENLLCGAPADGLRVTVRDSIYSGSDRMLHVGVTDALTLRVRVPGNGPSAHVPGDPLGLNASPDAIRVFPA